MNQSQKFQTLGLVATLKSRIDMNDLFSLGFNGLKMTNMAMKSAKLKSYSVPTNS